MTVTRRSALVLVLATSTGAGCAEGVYRTDVEQPAEPSRASTVPVRETPEPSRTAEDGSSADSSTHGERDPRAPAVRVLDPGAAPQRLLRHAWSAGDEARYRIRARTEVRQPGMDAQRLELVSTLSVRIDAVSAGRAKLVYTGKPLVPAAEDPPSGSGTGAVDAAGSVQVDAPPPDADPASVEAAEMLRHFVELGDPLPDAPVGSGARWAVTRLVLDDDGVELERRTEYDVVELGGQKVRVRIRRIAKPPSAPDAIAEERTEGELTITLGRVVPTGALTSTVYYPPAEAVIESTVTIERQ